MLPPNVTQKNFDTALAEWRGIVTPDWVLTGDDDLETYRDYYSPLFGEPGEIRASAAVCPANVEEVQRVVAVANRLAIPIFPISTGRNLGYGGSAPNLSGSVVLDLKRMNRIIEVDPVRGFALVEPGVSYLDLYRYIQDKGYKLMVDSPEPGWGSVMGNALDRGCGFTGAHMREHWNAQCGMEVVLASGELMRTGMGASSKATTWQDYRWGVGPIVDGLFSQGNFGIVTKIGIWLQPRPDAMFGGSIVAQKYTDIVPLVALLNELDYGGLVTGLPWISSPTLFPLVAAPDPALRALVGRAGGVDVAGLQAYAGSRPVWTMRMRFYDPEPVARAKWDYVKGRAAALIPGVTFADEKLFSFPITDEARKRLGKGLGPDEDRRINLGEPNMDVFGIITRSPLIPDGSHGHIWLSPVIPRDGESVMRMQNVLTRAALDADVYFGANAPTPMSMMSRAFCALLPFLIVDDPAVNKKTREAFKKMMDLCAKEGWLEYRTHTMFQDQLASYFDFNNHALRRFVETLKDAADPNGIISAGRYGIWPKAMRKGAA